MRFKNILGIMGVGMLTLLMILSGKSTGAETVSERIPVRIGWHVSSATQAQIVQVLKRTNVLEIHGLEPRLVPFSYGGPEVEAALAGKLDVLFAGDQGVINLIARGGKWKIVARLQYDQVAVMVPPNSPIWEIAELRGRTVASPFGSTGHREAILKQQAAGLDPKKDVKNVNLDILEIRRRVLAGGVESWGGIDAVAVWEPSVSEFEIEGHARSLSNARTMAVVAISDKFIAEHPKAAVQFLAALARAWYYLTQNTDRVRQWYIDDIQLGYSPAVLPYTVKADLNFSATSLLDIDLKLNKEDMAGFERSAAWGREQGYSKGEFQINQAVDQGLLAKADEIIKADRLEEIQVILPPAREVPTTESPNIYFFDRFPLGVMFVLIVLISFLGIEAGQILGRRRRRGSQHELEGPVGTVVGAVLGLLAFVIALTFATASDRFDARKQVLLDEVNAIGTAYLRAGLVPEPDKTTTRTLLRDYVEVRLGMYRVYDQPDKLKIVQGRTTALQESLWSHAEALAESDRHSEIDALFISSLNEVFDLHTKRLVLGAEYRIPFFVWCALGLVSCLAMFAVGFQFGIGGKRSITANVALSLAFALVILLIFDLDHPGKGLIDVNQQPMIELYQSLGKPG